MAKTLRLLPGALAALAVLGSTLAHADVRTDSQPDLTFVMWDSAARVSYTLDLGLDANSFWAYAQQDAGYTWSYTIPAADPRFAAFRAASTTITNQHWAVFAAQSDASSSAAGSNKFYSTLHQGPSGGALNPNYADMTGMQSADFLATTQRAGSRWFRDLNSLGNGESSAMNTHASSANGSAFHTGTSSRYFANNGTFYAQVNPGSDGSFYGGMFDVGNEVNKSSWFYAISNAANGAVVVDEFDNLSYNGYWGLALTSGNTYSLTYTLVAANVPHTAAATPEGSVRTLVTDYAAGTGPVRLIGTDDIALDIAVNGVAVSAVPEPSSALLLLGGLAGLVARRKARSRQG